MSALDELMTALAKVRPTDLRHEIENLRGVVTATYPPTSKTALATAIHGEMPV